MRPTESPTSTESGGVRPYVLNRSAWGGFVTQQRATDTNPEPPQASLLTQEPGPLGYGTFTVNTS